MPSRETANQDPRDCVLRDAARVLAGFGLATPTSVRPLRSGAGVARKHIIGLAGTGGAVGRVFLKEHARSERTVAELLERHRVIGHLAADGLPVPRPLQTVEGGTLLMNAASVFELFEFIDADPWAPSIPGAQAAGGLLAATHASLRRFGETTPHVLPRTGGLREADPPAVPGDSRNEIAILVDAAREASRLEGALPGREQPLHGDFHPGNTRWRSGRPAALLDFDCCRTADPVEEAALASVHFSLDRTPRAMDARTRWPDPDVYGAFWHGYLAGPAPGHSPVVLPPGVLPWLSAGTLARETLTAGPFDGRTVAFAAGVVSWFTEHADGLASIIASGPGTERS